MGSHCSKEGDSPDTSNVCNESIGGTHVIPDFCSPAGISGIESVKIFCGLIGNGEWEFDSQGDSCTYNDCRIPNAYHSGCCKGCCGVTGRKGVCKRKVFNGDPLTCCFRDMAENKQNRFCFDNDDEQNTCSTAHRNIVNMPCQDITEGFCLGDDLNPNDTSWFERWTPEGQDGKSCLYVLNRNLFLNPDTPGLTSGVPLDPSLYVFAEGFQFSKQLMTKVFDKYRGQGFVIGALPGFPGYDEFQTTIFSLCSTTPGLCEEGLVLICSDQTIESLTFNPELVPWCGCYMGEEEYSMYVDEFQVDKQCTPICARQGNIPIASSSGTGTVPCTQDVCIIDDVAITLANSEIGGGINFSQICGGCSGAAHGTSTSSSNNGDTNLNIQNQFSSSKSCRCIITNTSIDVASSRIGGGIDLNQTCGETACFRENPDFGKNSFPEQIKVPCDAPADFNPLDQENAKTKEEEEASFRRTLAIWLIVLGVIVLILIFIFLSDLGGNHHPVHIHTQPHTHRQDKTTRKKHSHISQQTVSRSILNRKANPMGNMGNFSIGIRNKFISNNKFPGYAGSISRKFY